MLDIGSDRPTQFNKRASPRYQVQLPVRFSSDLLVFDGTAEVEGMTTDVGKGGLFIRSDLLEPVGTRVRVRLLVSDSNAIVMQGAVAWVADGPPKGPGMGIALSRADQSYEKLIAALAG